MFVLEVGDRLSFKNLVVIFIDGEINLGEENKIYKIIYLVLI